MSIGRLVRAPQLNPERKLCLGHIERSVRRYGSTVHRGVTVVSLEGHQRVANARGDIAEVPATTKAQMTCVPVNCEPLLVEVRRPAVSALYALQCVSKNGRHHVGDGIFLAHLNR